ncbi:NPCBM/NEW2 domain-containing protein [Pseudoxanthomonas composti]|nr:NPCBM/NEW2 domain-containing protein [Pseudoxanthomonas composti]
MKSLLLALLMCLPLSAGAQDTTPEALRPSAHFSVYGHGAAATPPMGFNPWNAFRTEVDQARILAVAEFIEQHGLQQAGYRYINIDDGWWLKRGADGRIQIRTSMFPIATVDGGAASFRAWTDKLHAMGFKAGLYTDVGRNACSQAFDRHSPNLPIGTAAEREIGLQGFEAGDLRTMFQDWGFDYLKVDACGLADFGQGSEPVLQSGHQAVRPLIVRRDPVATDRTGVETQYARVGRLLAALNPDEDYVLAICPWGEAGVRDWGGRHGHLWRTSPDIEPTWDSMLVNLDSTVGRELYAGPGRWNDPDMLAVGLGEFDDRHLVNARSHFSLWAVLGAPLLMGFDLTQAPASLIELLSNPEVIAINQDPAGNQASVVVNQGDLQVLVKPLAASGERAVVLFNRGDTATSAQVTPAQLKLADGAPYQARDVWKHQALATQRGALQVRLAPHEAAMFKVAGAPVIGDAKLLTEMTGRIHVAVDGAPDEVSRQSTPGLVPRADLSPSGVPLRIAGQSIPYGLGALANSRFEVRLGKDFRQFSTRVGLQDGARRDAGVVFRVYGDGRLLQEVTAGAGDAQAVPVTVPVDGIDVLELVAIASPQAKAALPPAIVWGDAQLR